MRQELLARLLVRGRDVAGRVHADRSGLGLAHLGQRAAVEVGERGELPRGATDDGDDDGKAVVGGPDDRLRRASDTDPDGQVAGLRCGHDELDVNGRPDRALPLHRLLGDDGREKVSFSSKRVS